MSPTVGYVLVSRTHENYYHGCGLTGCTWPRLCPQPARPGCHASCVRDPKQLAQHPDCQEWQRAIEAWMAAHVSERPTGGTRLGPLHYFGDCATLLHRGPRREDARIVALDAGAAQALDLPPCKACQAKMAPLECQFDRKEGAEDSQSNRSGAARSEHAAPGGCSGTGRAPADLWSKAGGCQPLQAKS